MISKMLLYSLVVLSSITVSAKEAANNQERLQEIAAVLQSEGVQNLMNNEKGLGLLENIAHVPFPGLNLDVSQFELTFTSHAQAIIHCHYTYQLNKADGSVVEMQDKRLCKQDEKQSFEILNGIQFNGIKTNCADPMNCFKLK